MTEGHIFTDIVIKPDYADYIQYQVNNIIAEQGDVDRIIHHVASPGGSVYGAYKGFHRLIALGKPIDTIVEGEAQSAASFVILASRKTGGKIKVLNPSRIMIHEPRISPESLGTNYLVSDDLQRNADELRKIETEMSEIYVEATCTKKCMSMDEVKALMKKETNMTAREAVMLGFADEVISSIDFSENVKLKAVALGKKMEPKQKTNLQKVGEFLTEAAKLIGVIEVSAVDLKLKAGGDLHIESENGDLVGKPATKDGKPAEGTYPLDDGRTITCVAGLVTAVTEAPAAAAPPAAPVTTPAPAPIPGAQPTQQDLLAKQMAELQAKIDAMNKENEEKVKAEAEKKATEEKEKLVVALAEKEKEIEELKNQTVGSTAPPDTGLTHSRTPAGPIMQTSEKLLGIKATRTWIADNMPHLERFYKGGRFKDGTRFIDYRTSGPEAVSILETNLNYTWDGVLDLDILMKPTLGSPAIGDLGIVDTGAHFNKRYHLLGSVDNVYKPYTGCDQGVTGTNISITSKEMQLKKLQMYESWCQDDFTKYLTGFYNVLSQEWLKTGNEGFDPAGTPIQTHIMNLLKDAQRRSLFRRWFFGSTSSTSDNYNQINGMFTNLANDSGASNYCVVRVGSALGTGALSAGQSNTILAALYDGAPLLLQQEGIDKNQASIWVSRSIWNNYYTYLTGVGAVTEQQFENYVKGINVLTFRGTPVRPITIADQFLTESTNPWNATVRHFAIFTIQANNIFGVTDPSDMYKIDSWFEKKDNKRYYRSNVTIGFQKIHCELTAISY